MNRSSGKGPAKIEDVELEGVEGGSGSCHVQHV